MTFVEIVNHMEFCLDLIGTKNDSIRFEELSNDYTHAKVNNLRFRWKRAQTYTTEFKKNCIFLKMKSILA